MTKEGLIDIYIESLLISAGLSRGKDDYDWTVICNGATMLLNYIRLHDGTYRLFYSPDTTVNTITCEELLSIIRKLCGHISE